MDSMRAFVLHSLCDGVHTPYSLTLELADIATLADNFDLMELVKFILNEFCVYGLAEVTSA